jgi:hypothetical protein
MDEQLENCLRGRNVVNARTNLRIVVAAIIAVILGAKLSRTIEPGVRVENVTLAKGMTMLLLFVAAALVAGWH